MTIAFLTQDLVFQSKVNSVARAIALDCLADRSVERLVGRCAVPGEIRLWIIDLTLSLRNLGETVLSIKGLSPQAKLVAYAPHVHEARLEAARQAGIDLVLTRGQFDHQFSALIQSLVEEPSA
jgi:hypothetical protein